MPMLPRAVVCLLLSAAPASATRLIVAVPAETPADASVYLAGSTPAVGMWRADGMKLIRQPDGTFLGDVVGPMEFKVTRGSWETVEKGVDGGEVANRTLAGGVGELRVTVARWAVAGAPTSRPSTVTGDLRIETVAGRTIRVWLPPGYGEGEAAYPVLYLHDGQNCFDASTSAFGTEWQVDETLTRLIGEGRVPAIIVVGIDNAGARRIDEYTPTPDRGRGGGAAAYERYLVDVLKPHVDASYRTKPARPDTFVGGSSLGGLVSLDLVRRHPDIFGGALAMSPSLWWDAQSLLGELERAPLKAGSRVIATMGGREGGDVAARDAYVEQAGRLRRLLAAMPIRSDVTIDPEGQHDEAAWARQLPAALHLLLNP